VLLSSLEGYAITSIKIKGVDHEFSTIEGVVQDVTEIILNLKQVRFKKQIDSVESEKATLKVNKSGTVTAADIASSLSNFQVLNTEQLICEMDKLVNFEMEFTVAKGRGYVPADENIDEEAPIGTIAIDSIFTPIKNVNYNVENYRVGQKTDFEKLNLNITTDGSIEPKKALTEASKILIQHFMLFSDEKINLEEAIADEFDEDTLHMRQLLKTELTEFGLSVRALNCLKTAEVFTLGELVSFKKSDMLKFRNFGKKSLTELEELVKDKGLTFGYDTEKYN
jgi:DNA-directed RNA polymerase subunit alpha